MNEELKEAAEFFEVNCEEFEDEDYSFRPDVNFAPGETYSPKVYPHSMALKSPFTTLSISADC